MQIITIYKITALKLWKTTTETMSFINSKCLNGIQNCYLDQLKMWEKAAAEFWLLKAPFTLNGGQEKLVGNWSLAMSTITLKWTKKKQRFANIQSQPNIKGTCLQNHLGLSFWRLVMPNITNTSQLEYQSCEIIISNYLSLQYTEVHPHQIGLVSKYSNTHKYINICWQNKKQYSFPIDYKIPTHACY